MTEFDVNALSGTTVVDTGGNKIGKVGQVYLDDQTGQPEWVTVKTGLFGTKESFVPLALAQHDGGQLTVRATKDQVSGAPQVDEDGHISQQEENEIYRYYGLSGDGSGGGDGQTGTSGYATSGTSGQGTAGTAGTTGTAGSAGTTSGYETATAGHDTSGPDTDDAMTRSEEHLVAGTQQTEAGRARLRKHVVTETQQVQVPVSHEEVRLEREPITDANRDSAYSGGDITEEEHEVTLRAERPVVSTEAQPVERVRLGKETVTDTETVSGEVRKEQVEFDDSTDTSRR
jgi:uncharacterized protein (TIGR02271 family)